MTKPGNTLVRHKCFGLLIASAKSSYDTKNTQIKQLTANIILLDRLLELPVSA